MPVSSQQLREEFLHLLVRDSETKDRRRKDFNQALFDAEAGYPIWTEIDLRMVMEKFDKAVRNLNR